jgi:hypothetical protein
MWVAKLALRGGDGNGWRPNWRTGWQSGGQGGGHTYRHGGGHSWGEGGGGHTGGGVLETSFAAWQRGKYKVDVISTSSSLVITPKLDFQLKFVYRRVTSFSVKKKVE